MCGVSANTDANLKIISQLPSAHTFKYQVYPAEFGAVIFL